MSNLPANRSSSLPAKRSSTLPANRSLPAKRADEGTVIEGDYRPVVTLYETPVVIQVIQVVLVVPIEILVGVIYVVIASLREIFGVALLAFLLAGFAALLCWLLYAGMR